VYSLYALPGASRPAEQSGAAVGFIMTFNSVLSERHKGRGQMTARGGAAKEKSLFTNGMSCQALHDLQAIPGGGGMHA
jgi:hypothetical protein